MGWEQRGGGSYYYRKVREGGQVRSVYVGRGILGQECAEIVEEEQFERRAERKMHEARRQAEEEIDRQLAVAQSAISAVTDATLYAAGFRKHKGQWRKKRHEKKTAVSEEA
jgi:hypothetical protein